MTILASLQNLNLSFGEKVIFKDASFSINEFENIGLIGLNGKGKSTLLRIIDKQLSPDISSPPFLYDQNKALTILYIPQELDLKAPFSLVQDYYLNFYPELAKLQAQLKELENEIGLNSSQELIEKQSKLFHQIEVLEGWEIEKSYQSYLKKFSLTEFDKDIKQLSGGQKRKIALSVGLSAKHKLVLWDEPTNHLDIETIERFEDELKPKSNTFIMISHDRYILSSLCDRIVHIHNGKIEKFNGNYLDYLSLQNELEQERQNKLDKLKNTHRRELAWMRQGIKARGTRSKKRVEGFHNIEGNIQNLKDQKKKALNLSINHSQRKSKELLEAKQLGFAYDNTEIFKEVTLKIFKGDRIALIGKNGSGKSTFLNIISGSILNFQGEIKKLDQLSINYFSQNRKALDPNKSAFEIIGDGQDMVHLPNGHTIHVNSYLDRFLFESSELRRPISTLSGGEKNRLQLALFMKQAADLWIFDEPTNDLDIETIETLEQTLIDYDQAVIIVSHDRAFLDRVTTKSWIIKDYTISEFPGNYSDNADLLIEEEIKEIKKSPLTKEKKLSVKLSNKEKQRLKVIDEEIEQVEQTVASLNSKIEALDFSLKETAEEFQNLQKELKNQEEALENLYQEWEDLNEKQELQG